MKRHFEDPDLLSYQREKLLNLKHTSGNLLDHITEFETLCAQIGWPDDTKASIFLSSLQLGLRGAIKRSDIDIDQYEKVKQKAIRLEREFQESRKQRSSTRRTDQSSVKTNDFRPNPKSANSNPGPEMNNSRSEHLKKGLCFNCDEHGHLAKDAISLRRFIPLIIVVNRLLLLNF